MSDAYVRLWGSMRYNAKRNVRRAPHAKVAILELSRDGPQMKQSVPPKPPQGAGGRPGACCHAIPHPRKPPWTPMKPFLCILYVIMFLCDSLVRSSASRAVPSRGSRDQVTAGLRIGLVPLRTSGFQKVKISLTLVLAGSWQRLCTY